MSHDLTQPMAIFARKYVMRSYFRMILGGFVVKSVPKLRYQQTVGLARQKSVPPGIKGAESKLFP